MADEQTYEQAVREGRIFYRRRLAEWITRELIRTKHLASTEELAAYAVQLADEVTTRLLPLEESDLRKLARQAKREAVKRG